MCKIFDFRHEPTNPRMDPCLVEPMLIILVIAGTTASAWPGAASGGCGPGSPTSRWRTALPYSAPLTARYSMSKWGGWERSTAELQRGQGRIWNDVIRIEFTASLRTIATFLHHSYIFVCLSCRGTKPTLGSENYFPNFSFIIWLCRLIENPFCLVKIYPSIELSQLNWSTTFLEARKIWNVTVLIVHIPDNIS